MRFEVFPVFKPKKKSLVWYTSAKFSLLTHGKLTVCLDQRRLFCAGLQNLHGEHIQVKESVQNGDTSFIRALPGAS